jgi:2-polyprenyl-3-methyl-5-hydroxy-6-metoxy-1,4-benzoquinol methylase
MPDLEAQYTQGLYLEKARDWHDSDSHFRGADVHKILTRNNISPKTVVDVGCGAGGVLLELQKRLPADTRFFGYDISPTAISFAIKRANDNLTYLNKNILDESPNEPRDVLVMTDVFEHVPDYLGFLKSMRPYARYFVFHIPLDIFVTGVFGGKYVENMRRKWGHIHVFNKDTALMALQDADYKVIDWFYTVTDLDSPEWMHNLPGYYLWRAWRRFQAVLHRIWPDFTARFFHGYNVMVLAEPMPDAVAEAAE